MTIQTALPAQSATPDQPVVDIEWFGASARIVGGQPDARYGWWARREGPCIVKAMDPGLTAWNPTLLDHERRMLARLAEIGAPVVSMVQAGRPDWLVTRFAGLSLARLRRAGGAGDVLPPLATLELWSAWLHLLPALHRLATRGVLVLDLHAGNVLLPLTQGVLGQPRLNEPILVDGAHVQAAGMDLRRPVWIDSRMAHIAPELRPTLESDIDTLKRRFLEQAAELPGYSRLPGELDQRSRRAWADYDAPQRLQALLDAGELDCDRAMQHAVGVALRGLPVPHTAVPARQALLAAVQRLHAPRPQDRFESLAAAEGALREALRNLPLVGSQRRGPIGAAHLMLPPKPAAAACAAEPRARPPERAPVARPVAHVAAPHRRWLWAAAALGGALGAALPLGQATWFGLG